MRILYISDYFLSEPDAKLTGAHRRMDLFIKALSGIAHLDILFYIPENKVISPDAIVEQERTLSSQWKTQVKLFLCPGFSLPKWKRRLQGIFHFSQQSDFTIASGSEQIQALKTCLKRCPDAIFVRRLQSINPVLQIKQPLPPVFFDLDDIEHIKLIRSLRYTILRQKTYYLHLPALWWGELQAIRLACRTFICSEFDRIYLSSYLDLRTVVNIPNAITIPAAHPLSNEKTLLLLGTYTYSPNSNAADFLIEQVFPLVQKEIPDAKLIIAGDAPENIRNYVKSPMGVEFTGFVDNLDALYQRSRVVCCPIFSGGGTRVKMIEAAAYGKPIVATHIGVQGLEMTPDEDYLLRNTAVEFANACVDLLRKDDLCNFLGCNARATAIKHYDSTSIVKLIQHEIISAIESQTNK